MTVIAHVSIGDAAVQEEAGNVCVLWFVGGVELVGMIVQPNFKLFMRGLLAEVRWRLPRIEDAAKTWMVGVGIRCS